MAECLCKKHVENHLLCVHNGIFFLISFYVNRKISITTNIYINTKKACIKSLIKRSVQESEWFSVGKKIDFRRFHYA